MAAACDTADEADSAVVGTWRLLLLEDGEGDKTVTLDKAAQSLLITFNGDGTFTYTLDFVRTDDIVLKGAYELSGVSLTLRPQGGDVIAGEYVADGTGALLLAFPDSEAARLLGPGYSGTIRMSFIRDR